MGTGKKDLEAGGIGTGPRLCRVQLWTRQSPGKGVREPTWGFLVGSALPKGVAWLEHAGHGGSQESGRGWVMRALNARTCGFGF